MLTHKQTITVTHLRAHVAQSAERVLGKDEVGGSNPLVGSIGKGIAFISKQQNGKTIDG